MSMPTRPTGVSKAAKRSPGAVGGALGGRQVHLAVAAEHAVAGEADRGVVAVVAVGLAVADADDHVAGQPRRSSRIGSSGFSAGGSASGSGWRRSAR